ncbi:HD-GYP domain-containing protein [Streptomyces sp. NPDC051976]|uniref:HD-GYP domain-containing protein n=1 Tax=Streptomyces sp. NPDC051976 TaxID=3154947 RepID=UPI00344931CE
MTVTFRTLPPSARVTIAAVCTAGALCGGPAVRLATPWGTVAVLAALYALSEPGVLPGRRAPDAPRPSRRTPRGLLHEVLRGRPSGVPARVPPDDPATGTGPFLPLLLAAALLLPPAAASLVALPGSLAGRADEEPRRVRRVWRAAHLAVAVWAAALTARLLGGPRAVAAADLPYALLPATAAAVAFCLTATALTGAVLVTAERRTPAAAWGGPLLGSLAPHLTYGLVALMTAVLWRGRGHCGEAAALLAPLPMYAACRFFAQSRREQAAHRATVRALVQAVEIKDRYTRGHSERVGRASAAIARELGMAESRVDVLRFAGILHDIGKLGVPTRVLRKAGPLTAQERRVIQLHPEYGHEMVHGIGFLDEARSAILHHHERLDGRGYPYGLRGRQIPESARLVAVADAFDAMTSTRCYGRARSVPDAVAELHACAGTHFDPTMVAALTRALTAAGELPPPRPACPCGATTAGEGPLLDRAAALRARAAATPSGAAPDTRRAAP